MAAEIYALGAALGTVGMVAGRYLAAQAVVAALPDGLDAAINHAPIATPRSSRWRRAYPQRRPVIVAARSIR